MADEIVETKYVLDVDNYVTNINKAQKETQDLDKDQDKLSENSKISWDKMGIAINQWLEVAKKAKELFEVIIRTAVDFRNAADEQEDSVSALDLQLRNMNQYTIYTSESLQNLAKELENSTNFTDNQVMEAEKLMLTFANISTDVLPDAIEKLLDMSEVMEMDAKSAAMQLGKALNDPIEGVSALKRVGVTLSEQQKASIQDFMDQNDIMSAQKVILAELDKEFGGHAKLQKDEVESLTIAWQNFKEVLGTAVKPAVDAVSTMLSQTLSNFAFLLNYNKNAKKAMSGDFQGMTKDDLEMQAIRIQKDIDSRNKEIEKINKQDVRYRDVYKLSRLENEIQARENIIGKIEKELKLMDIKNKDQEVINQKIKKEADEAKKIADEKKESEKRAKAEAQNSRLKLTQSKDPVAARFGDYETYETKVLLSSLDAQKEVNAQKEKQEKEHREKMAKIKEDDLEYTAKLNADIRERGKDAREKELKDYEKGYEKYYKNLKKNADKQATDKEKSDEKIANLNDRMKESYKDVANVTTQALADVLLGEQKSLAEYGKILADKLAQRLAYVSAEATIQAIWETAQGLGDLALAAMGNPLAAESAGLHFESAAAFAQTAAVAGLGAFAAAGVSRGLGGSSDNTDNPLQNTETANMQTESTAALEEKQVIYISENDFKKMAFYNVDMINEALKSGKSLKVRGG